jgi:4-hydroxy-3-methylbut-2-enyl diphosphate reductase
LKITVCKSAGFCFGVQNAVDTALAATADGGRVFTFGEIIHNEYVVEELRERGITVTEDPSEIQPGDTVVIRAHGLPESVIEAVKARGAKVLDATCPFVKKIHKIVRDAAARGKQIIVAGDLEHPETIGILSYAGGNAVPVSRPENAFKPSSDAVIVAQTTFSGEKFKEIVKKTQNYLTEGNNSLEVFDTICYTTRERQEETLIGAASVDAVYVIGSASSSNTRRLYELAKSVCANTFRISNADELSPRDEKKKFKSILITAGASTPPRLVEEVVRFMAEDNTQNNATDVTEQTPEQVEETNIVADNKEAAVEEKAVAVVKADAVEDIAVAADEKAVAGNEKALTMDDIIASDKSMQYTEYKEGRRYKCTVVLVNENGVYVSLGGKKEGLVDKSEISVDGTYNSSDFKIGDTFDAELTDLKATPIKLSKKNIDVRLKEDAEAEKALAAGEFKLIATRVEKGGLSGKLGKYTVFIPASQIKIGFVKNLEEYVGKELRLRALPPKAAKGPAEGEESADAPKKRSGRSIVASQRIILEEEKVSKEDEFWNSIQVNDIVVGKVKRFTPFGAFVSVKGFDCLAHISELAWNKISDPAKVLKIGNSYDFVVLKMERAVKVPGAQAGRGPEKGKEIQDKISLGYKQLQKKPYELAAEKYPVDTVIKGKVERVFPFGAFVSIENEEGVDGLVHVSQISYEWVKDANDLLKPGQEVEAKVIGFEDSRITLSIKALLPEPENAPVSEESQDDSGKPAPKRNLSRFAKREPGSASNNDERKERRPSSGGGAPASGERRAPRRDDKSNEPTNWTTGSGSATIADILKGLELKVEDDAGDKGDKD